MVNAFWLPRLKLSFLVTSVLSWSINPPILLLVKTWVASVPTKVILKSGIVIVLFPDKAEVENWA